MAIACYEITDLLAKFVMKTTEGVLSRKSSVMLISSCVR